MCTLTCDPSSSGPVAFFFSFFSVLYISILLSAGLSAEMEERKCCRVQQDQRDTAKILSLLWIWTIKLKKPAASNRKK